MQLERLKNGNTDPLHPNNVHHMNPEIQNVEKEMLQLNKVCDTDLFNYVDYWSLILTCITMFGLI